MISIVLVLATSLPARADGVLTQSDNTAVPSAPAPKSPAPKDWKNETEATCGMSCRYSRAAENLTLQAVYLLKKVELVKAAVKDSSKEKEARAALGGFCRDSAEAIGECFKRYKDFQRIGLLEIRNSLGKIDEYKKNLINGVRADGTVNATALVYETGVENSAYIPDVPTLPELEKAYIDGNLRPARGRFSAEDVRKWSQELVVNDPKVRYIQYKKDAIDGNPYQSSKTSYRLYIGDTSKDGKLSADPAAMKLYEQSKQRVLEYSKDKAIDKGHLNAVTPQETKQKDKLSYEAIKDARNALNSKIEGNLKEEDAKRAPASKAEVKSPESDKPSSKRDGESKDILLRDPAGIKAKSDPRDQNDDYKVVPPEGLKDSRYIKYNIHQLLKDIESGTQ